MSFPTKRHRLNVFLFIFLTADQLWLQLTRASRYPEPSACWRPAPRSAACTPSSGQDRHHQTALWGCWRRWDLLLRRNKETNRDEFIFYSKRLMRLLIEHALSFLPLEVSFCSKPLTLHGKQGSFTHSSPSSSSPYPWRRLRAESMRGRGWAGRGYVSAFSDLRPLQRSERRGPRADLDCRSVTPERSPV